MLSTFWRAPQAQKRALLELAWARFQTQILYRSAFGSLGAGTIVRRPIMLQNTRHVYLGSKVVIRDGARFDIVTERQGQKFTPVVTIGDGALFEQGFHLACAEKITIGARVTCSRNVGILDVWHEYADVTTPIIDQPLGSAPVEIREGALIGMNSVILPGVTIGRQCMIGANSVVNRDVPDFCVAAGAPARVIKRYDFERAQWVHANQEMKQ